MLSTMEIRHCLIILLIYANHIVLLHMQRSNLIVFLMIIIVVIALNIISSFVFTRIDLTAEKRYTISNSTRTMLKNLDDIVYIKVYLDGKGLPADFAELS